MKFSNLNRIYIPTNLAENNLLNLIDNNFHYIKTVLRLKVNDQIRVFNENDGEFIAQITNITKNNLFAKINKQFRSREKINFLELALSIIKADKLTLAINIAVQLGVTHITLLRTERSQIYNINHQRLFKSIIEATEQSERLSPPLLNPIISLSSYLNNNKSRLILYANEHENKNSLIDVLALSKELCYMVGPEGGFSNTELELLADKKNTESFTLGNNVLRSETAVAAGLAQINLYRCKMISS